MSETLTDSRHKDDVKEPSMWQVFILNDDSTPMVFVEHILAEVFHMQKALSHKTMMTAHSTGKAACGVYTMEVAETKVNKVKEKAGQKAYPLKAIMKELT